MKRTALSVLFVALGSSVLAEGPDAGCYARDYSAAHLAKHPKQVVDDVVLWIYEDELGNKLADMDVTFAKQGHVAASMFAGQTLNQFLLCFDSRGRAGCAVECDGGAFVVVKDTPEAMTIETEFLLVGDTEECGGAVDMAEVPGKAVRYRLNRVAASQCEGLGQPFLATEPNADIEGDEDK
ncbi:hypothetical protein BXY66_1997 [Shimia isoporae]|uniref:Uncharacterized protein n=1 Tax=Shimia isoporae TaxID=647720 RepID=A0A4V2Q461_9RHOB|nr:hypothetical protein [Shimia isoporae]TCL09930.1 hypothetical protein BXY66_1997 [Shimia isoporae]